MIIKYAIAGSQRTDRRGIPSRLKVINYFKFHLLLRIYRKIWVKINIEE